MPENRIRIDFTNDHEANTPIGHSDIFEGGGNEKSERNNNSHVRDFGDRGRDYDLSSSQPIKKEISLDLHLNQSNLNRTESNYSVNLDKVYSSSVGIGVSSLGLYGIIAGGTTQAITLTSGLLIIGSAFAIPSLIFSVVGLIYALNGEKNEDIYDSFDLATNPYMLGTYVSSTLLKNDKKTAMQHSKIALTISKTISAKNSLNEKKLKSSIGLTESLFLNLDALDTTLSTKNDLDKIRMSMFD